MTKSAFTRQQDQLRRMLLEARTSQGLTQAQLAKRLRRTQSFVSKYERAQRRLDIVEFLEVLRALDLDPHRVIDALGRES